jgi:hypothetical protein
LNQKQQKAFLAFVNQLMRLGFLRIHQLSKKSDFFAKGVFFLLTSPLMGDPKTLNSWFLFSRPSDPYLTTTLNISAEGLEFYPSFRNN